MINSNNRDFEYVLTSIKEQSQQIKYIASIIERNMQTSNAVMNRQVQYSNSSMVAKFKDAVSETVIDDISDDAASNIADKMVRNTFRVNMVNAFSDIVQPLKDANRLNTLDLMENANRNHVEMMSVLQKTNTVSERTNSGISDTYKSIKVFLGSKLREILFGRKEKELSVNEKILNAIHDQTEFFMTGGVDKTKSTFDRIIKEGLIGYSIKSVGRGILSSIGISETTAQQREMQKSLGQRAKGGFIGQLADMMYGGDIVRYGRKGGILPNAANPKSLPTYVHDVNLEKIPMYFEHAEQKQHIQAEEQKRGTHGIISGIKDSIKELKAMERDTTGILHETRQANRREFFKGLFGLISGAVGLVASGIDKLVGFFDNLLDKGLKIGSIAKGGVCLPSCGVPSIPSKDGKKKPEPKKIPVPERMPSPSEKKPSPSEKKRETIFEKLERQKAERAEKREQKAPKNVLGDKLTREGMREALKTLPTPDKFGKKGRARLFLEMIIDDVVETTNNMGRSWTTPQNNLIDRLKEDYRESERIEKERLDALGRQKSPFEITKEYAKQWAGESMVWSASAMRNIGNVFTGNHAYGNFGDGDIISGLKYAEKDDEGMLTRVFDYGYDKIYDLLWGKAEDKISTVSELSEIWRMWDKHYNITGNYQELNDAFAKEQAARAEEIYKNSFMGKTEAYLKKLVGWDEPSLVEKAKTYQGAMVYGADGVTLKGSEHGKPSNIPAGRSTYTETMLSHSMSLSNSTIGNVADMKEHMRNLEFINEKSAVQLKDTETLHRPVVETLIEEGKANRSMFGKISDSFDGFFMYMGKAFTEDKGERAWTPSRAQAKTMGSMDNPDSSNYTTPSGDIPIKGIESFSPNTREVPLPTTEDSNLFRKLMQDKGVQLQPQTDVQVMPMQQSSLGSSINQVQGMQDSSVVNLLGSIDSKLNTTQTPNTQATPTMASGFDQFGFDNNTLLNVYGGVA
jgi:hypothetical protein